MFGKRLLCIDKQMKELRVLLLIYLLVTSSIAYLLIKSKDCAFNLIGKQTREMISNKC